MIVLWTANTERFADVVQGLNDTADNLLRSIEANEQEISPSTLFAVASISEGVSRSLYHTRLLIIILLFGDFGLLLLNLLAGNYEARWFLFLYFYCWRF